MASSLTNRQLTLKPFEFEREVVRLRYDARLARLDGRNANARRFDRQADELTRLLPGVCADPEAA